MREIISIANDQTKSPEDCQQTAIICFSDYSTNVLENSHFWCLDGHFNYSPRSFYQQFEFLAFNKFSGKFEMSLIIYMTHKSQELYMRVFSAVQFWFKRNKNKKLKPKRILIDFENALINSCKKIFKQTFNFLYKFPECRILQKLKFYRKIQKMLKISFLNFDKSRISHHFPKTKCKI